MKQHLPVEDGGAKEAELERPTRWRGYLCIHAFLAYTCTTVVLFSIICTSSYHIIVCNHDILPVPVILSIIIVTRGDDYNSFFCINLQLLMAWEGRG